MIWIIISAVAIVISACAVAYHLGKNDGIEIAFGEMERIMETVVALMEEEQQEQQEKEKFENIFEEFK